MQRGEENYLQLLRNRRAENTFENIEEYYILS